MIWFFLWLVISVYFLASVLLLIAVACRWAWAMLPENPEIVARKERIRHDKAIVAAGREPGYHRSA